MRILFLDDMEVRHTWFDRKYPQHTVDHAYNVEEAIFYLNLRKYEVVFLDHDLSLDHYSEEVTSKQEGTGCDVAEFIARMDKDTLPSQVVIHSWNPVGADRMKFILEDKGMFVDCVPFKNT